MKTDEPSTDDPSSIDAATETTALLGRTGSASSNGTIPKTVDGVLPNGTFTNGNVKDGSADEEEPEEADGSREAQFEGMPEVRKNLKWIAPAVSIGILLSAADQTIIVSSYGRIGSDLQALSNTSWVATS